MGFGVWGLGFGVWGLGFGVWGLGFGVWGLGLGVWDFGFRWQLMCRHSEATQQPNIARTWGTSTPEFRSGLGFRVRV